MNPGGSNKDRIGRYMIETAENEGKLRAGGAIVESTSATPASASPSLRRGRGTAASS